MPDGRCSGTECWYQLPLDEAGLIPDHSKAGTLDVCEGGGKEPLPPLQRAEITLPEAYTGNIGELLDGFAGDVAFEVSGLMENTEVRNVRILVTWEGTY